MPQFFPPLLPENLRIMIFVDGENLAIRYKAVLEKNKIKIPSHVSYEENIFVWSTGLNNICVKKNVIRKYYYTSVVGDDDKIKEITNKLKKCNIEAPNVFKKTKTRGSKRVDISLATDMLSHSSRNNYDIAILIAGDEDYVPLVEAVKLEGHRVFVWFFEDEGLSESLRISADKFSDIGKVLLSPDLKHSWQ